MVLPYSSAETQQITQITMPTKSKNCLKIEPMLQKDGQPETDGNGKSMFRLFGYVDGEKIRKRSTDLGSLELIKQTKESAWLAKERGMKESAAVRQTWLTADQLRDAEAAFRSLAAGRSLVECVEAANRVLGTGEPKPWADAVTAYETQMKARKLSKESLRTALFVLKEFKISSRVSFVHEATSEMIETFVFGSENAEFTQLTYAGRLHAFFQFCMPKWRKINPVSMNLTELREKARRKMKGEILTPEESQALLNAACAANEPAFAFAIIAGLWCYLRQSEIKRLTGENVIVRKQESGVTTIKLHLMGEKKGSKWRDVFVPPILVPLAQECLKLGVFTTKTGTMHLPQRTWGNIRETAGLMKWKNKTVPAGGNRVGTQTIKVIESSKWGKNVLRHTGASYCFQETGGDAELVARRAGNSADVLFMHYLRHAPEDAYKKFNAITASFPIAQDDAQSVG